MLHILSILRLLKENLGRTLPHTGTGKEFLNRLQSHRKLDQTSANEISWNENASVQQKEQSTPWRGSTKSGKESLPDICLMQN